MTDKEKRGDEGNTKTSISWEQKKKLLEEIKSILLNF